MANEDELFRYLKRVTADLRDTRAELAATRDREPIALVAASCRFPGGLHTPEQLWEFVRDGREAVSGFPTDRGWAPGGGAGGFLHDAAEFDPALFGISPREALAMDPQQRIALELAWEAFERAGVDPLSVSGSRTGVYLGVMYHDYAGRFATAPAEVAGHLGTGGTASIASGRIAHTLGLRGPAVTLDTACSSSLVAVHLAVRALRAGECDAALAGGVTVMSTPTTFAEFSTQGGMSPDGRCRAFGAGADGTGWSEGGAFLLLERLSDAHRLRHEVLAVVRGTAVNSDGKSSGLTAPSGPAQERVLAEALADAGLAPSDVDLVEAHGTGTRLGDPIEARALAVVHADRDRPLWLGSVKSNLGHTQAAAGAAGVIKVALALQHRELAPTLHAAEPNPDIDWSGPLALVTERTPWPSERPRRAGVSSFGISGTNAHVLLEEAPGPPPLDEPGTPLIHGAAAPWLVSGQDERALREQARALAGVVAEHDPADVAFTLAAGRAALPERAVVTDPAALAAVADGEAHPELVVSTARRGRVVFLYPGQGSQWVGMGARLLGTCPLFAAAVRECEDALRPHVPWSLTDVLRSGHDLDRVEVVQPVLWAVMVALTRVWGAAGVRPDVVVGHSQGEIAAACAAGVLNLADGARVVAMRAGLIARELAGTGAMAAVEMPPDDLDLPKGVSIAAANGPASTTVSGDPEAVRALLAELRERGIRVREISVDYASHSAQVERIADELPAALAGITPEPGHTVLHSTVTGQPVEGTDLGPEYWYRNLRDRVRFAEVIAELGDDAVFVEPSAHPTLVPVVAASAPAVGTLTRDDGTPDQLLRALAEAWAAGAPVDWRTVLDGTGNLVQLPTYRFQRSRFWLDGPASGPDTAPWCYRTTWQPVATSAERLSGQWLVVSTPTARWTRETGAALRDAGAEPIHFTWDATVPAALADHIRSDPPAGVVVLVDPQADTWWTTAAQALAAVRTVAGVGGIRLWLVTEGTDAPVAALGRVAGLEHPEWWGGVAAVTDASGLGRLPGLLVGAEDDVVVDDRGVQARRLVRAAMTSTTRWQPRGTALVTGGTGAVGGHVARWLAAGGCERVILLGRRGPDAPGAAELVDQVRAAGAEAQVLACDVSDRNALAAVLDDLQAAGTPVTSVFHTAGAAEASPLLSTSENSLVQNGSAKVVGARNLDALLADAPLDAFVLFSSGAGVWGGAGQGAYAAANAALDALAEDRRARGLTALSVAWGAWSGGGMAEDSGAAADLAAIGVRPMAPAAALDLLALALPAGETALVVADLDWAVFAPTLSAARHRPLLQGVPQARAGEPAEPAGTSEWQREVSSLPRAARERAATDLVRAETAAVLGHDSPSTVSPRRAFRDLGVDSLSAVRLRDRLRRVTGVALPATAVFDHPTPAELARVVLGGTERAERAPEAAVDDDPVVVVAVGCRFPGGVDSPETLWDLVSEGREARGGFPDDRGWDSVALAAALPAPESRTGGFLADATGFDAGLFGISPREAVAMDPQQRVLLETTWEAFERLGLRAGALRGSRTGVFVGGAASHYGLGSLNADNAEGHLLTGTSTAVLSGRLSYAFDLAGPSVTLDTACSSALVALHWAAGSLRSGECSLAVVAGVSVMAVPAAFTEFAKQGGLSSDGRCKAFAEGADGTGWSEGAGVLLVERLSTAREQGHPVLAVVRGTAVNSDGASNGISAPNGPAQQRVVRAALADAGLSPADVDVVEAHGTGTALGDPIEANALLGVFGARGADQPVWLGSVKSNLGHTQSAAGAAGLIKVIQAIAHQRLPRTLHADAPTPHVDWTSGVRLLTEERPWPAGDRVRRAGVSAFGVSGTNAHVVIEEPPAPPAPEPQTPRVHVAPWVLSARGTPALRAAATALACVKHDRWDLASGLARHRTALPDRAVVVGTDQTAALAAFGRGEAHPDVLVGSATEGPLAVVFSGQGTQRPGMGRELCAEFPVYAEAFDEVCAAVDPHLNHPLAEIVLGERGELLDRTEFAQPAIFAVEVALFRLWESWGVTADVVLGHSIGEIAAAHVAGALDLADAARLITARAAAMQSLPDGGAMVVVGLPVAEAELLATGDLAVAAVNNPGSTVLSGPKAELLDAVRPLRERGVRLKELRVSHAFHSPLMDPALDAIAAVAALIDHRAPEISVISTLTGAEIREFTPDHWVRHARDRVRFADAVRALPTCRAVLEVGPSGGLVDHIESAEAGPAVAATGRDPLAALERALAALVVSGVDPDYDAVFPGPPTHRPDLPTYRFQHEHYWLDAPAPPRRADTYEVIWQPVVDLPDRVPPGEWAVVAAHPHLPLAYELALRLTDCGATASVTTPADLGASPAPARILSLLALDTTEVPGTPGLSRGLVDTINLVRSVAGTGTRVWSVTRGARTDPAQAAVWGLGRAIALEHPQEWAGVVDLPTAVTPDVADQLPQVLDGWEDQVEITSEGVFARRLVVAAPSPEPAWTPRGTVLVTGGTGALGAHTARHLLRSGAEHVVLLSRSGPDALGARRLAAELGPAVSTVRCDVTDRAALGNVLARTSPTAVVHAAGVGEVRPLADTTPESLAEVFAAKVSGAENLDALLADTDLDAFVLYSSVAATWGSAEQAGYAAANAHLDALAARRRARGLRARAIAWGPWAGNGMASDAEFTARLARIGLRTLTPGRAVEVLTTPGGDQTVADVDWPVFVPRFTATRPSPLLATMAAADKPAAARADLAGLPEGELRAQLLDEVRTAAAAVLGHAGADAVPADRAFADLGVDSLLAVELRDRLVRSIGGALPSTLVFDHPTPTRLAEHLAGGFDAAPAPAAVAPGEPIAVVAMACRFAGGVRSPEDLWELLVDGRDAVTGLPTDRGWDLAALAAVDPGGSGASTALAGGFLDDVAGFDAALFGVSPREALSMDPQQRVVLEVAWEAFERAGLPRDALRGSRTGVFLGGGNLDYVSVLRADGDAAEGHLLTGNTGSVASGRVAYAFGLRGPALTVDTACSSSLVALHLAVRSLRAGECERALAGGVTIMSTPTTFTEFSKQGGLAADGRCKAFAADADGTGWGEGAGLVLLERLSDARKHGHEVLAVLSGTAVNSDGDSNGLTAPSGPAQQQVIREALADAGLELSDVDAVEAHGTGTRLGDPIELHAVRATYGADRTAPVPIGSVKSNIGHTQAAAGIAGVIKSVLSLRGELLPRTLHADRPTPHLDWAAGNLALLTGARPFPRRDRARRIGVSAFGISGTNAHVVVSEGDPAPPPAGPGVVPGAHAAPWVLSAADPGALRAQAVALAEAAAHVDPEDVAHTLATARTQLPERAVLVQGDPAERCRALAEFAAGIDTPGVVTGRAGHGDLAVAFSGQGTQHPHMGLDLRLTFPVFAEAFDEACDALDEHLPTPVQHTLSTPDALTRNAQPAIFAHQTALFRQYQRWGFTPTILIGHSIGEITAAHVSGALSLRDAARLVTTRARLIHTLPAGGTMVAVALSESAVAALLAEDTSGTVGLAAVNGAESVVLSGSEDTLRALLAGRGLRTTWLPVSHAFHSPLMDPVVAEFREMAAYAKARPPQIPVISTVTGAPVTAFTADHWVRHLRGTVRFDEAVGRLRGVGTILEVGADATLTGLLRKRPGTPFALPSQRRGRPQVATLATALATLLARGVPADPALMHRSGRTIPLPTYRFQHERYWPTTRHRSPAVGAEQGHPLLGAAVEVADTGELLHTGTLSTADTPWLADHSVLGRPVLPGAALVELAAHAAQRAGASQVEELVLEAPLVLPETGGVQVQVAVSKDSVRVHSTTDHGTWVRHATGTLSTAPQAPLEPVEITDGDEVPLTEVYERFAKAGLDYGPAFQALRSVRAAADGAIVDVEASTLDDGYLVYPALLDAVLQGAAVAGLVGTDDTAVVPFSWNGVRWFDQAAPGGLRAIVTPAGENALSLRLNDSSGRTVLTVDRVNLRALSAGAVVHDALRRLTWEPVDVPPGAPVPTTIVSDVDNKWPEDGTALLVCPAGDGDPWSTAEWVLRKLQNWVADPKLGERQLVVVTGRGVRCGDDEVPDPWHAAVWGLVRSAQAEYPGRFTLLDGPPSVAADALRTGAGQVAVRDGQILVPRLVAAPAAPEPEWSGGTVLVTGGSGALAKVLLPHLATRHGVRRVRVLSRTPDAVDLPDTAAEVSVHPGNPANRADLAAALADIPAEHPLVAALHLAGTTADATLTEQDGNHLAAAFHAKVLPAHHLRDLMGDRVDVIHFSSASAVLGAPGQAAYAAANACLDALTWAAPRTTALAWGLWDVDGGMAGGLARAGLARGGLTPITPATGLALFDAAAGARGVVVPLPLDRSALRRQPAERVPEVLRGTVPARVRATPGRRLAAELAELPPHEQRDRITDLVRSRVAAVLGYTGAVRPDVPFTEMGFDSLTAVELRGALDADTGLRLPATLVFDHPTPAQLAEAVLERLCPAPADPVDSVLAQLDRLESAVADVPAGDERVQRRLRALLMLTGGGVQDLPPAHPVGTPEAEHLDDLSDADLEHVLGIVDEELGPQ